MTKLIVALAFLALNVYTYHFMARKAVIPERELFASFPLEFDDWSCGRNEPLDPVVKTNLGATDTLICNYIDAARGQWVEVYLGYHATQVREEGGGASENAIHPPAHCLPGSGWDIIESTTVSLERAGVTDPGARAKRLVIAKGEHRQLVYYWYQMQGRSIAEDWQKVLYVGWDRATNGRTDGALVRFTIPLRAGDEEAADRAFRELAPRIVGLLPRYVPV